MALTKRLVSIGAPAVTRALGSGAVAASWRRLRPGLRVLAYHDVPDAALFASHLDLVQDAFTVVSAAEVHAARSGEATLPDDAVWITFDDGDKTVVTHAQPALVERGMPATLFVCPGLLVERRRPWWRTVSDAAAQSIGATVEGQEMRGSELTGALKRVSDRTRREVVAGLEAAVPVSDPTVITLAELRGWQEAGLDIGNHTWDHPCLDRCDPADQTDQIVRAHEWIAEHLAPPRLLFAYPNGNRTDHALEVLHDLGYDAPLLFDHRINDRETALTAGAELSRLRIDATATVPRARAILGGVHSDLFELVRSSDTPDTAGAVG